MDAKTRRQAILTCLRESTTPVPASALGRELGVSRQIVVGDVALLRAASHSIMATNRGYVLAEPEVRPRRRLRVHHRKEDIRAEMEAVVDAGGTIVDTIVDHGVYGSITAEVDVSNRTEVEDFVARFEASSPLLDLDHGHHQHTVEAGTETQLDRIEARLAELGFLDSHPATRI